eukprot:jgi/Bigna1/128125/aug1.6_g2833
MSIVNDDDDNSVHGDLPEGKEIVVLKSLPCLCTCAAPSIMLEKARSEGIHFKIEVEDFDDIKLNKSFESLPAANIKNTQVLGDIKIMKALTQAYQLRDPFIPMSRAGQDRCEAACEFATKLLQPLLQQTALVKMGLCEGSRDGIEKGIERLNNDPNCLPYLSKTLIGSNNFIGGEEPCIADFAVACARFRDHVRFNMAWWNYYKNCKGLFEELRDTEPCIILPTIDDRIQELLLSKPDLKVLKICPIAPLPEDCIKINCEIVKDNAHLDKEEERRCLQSIETLSLDMAGLEANVLSMTNFVKRLEDITIQSERNVKGASEKKVSAAAATTASSPFAHENVVENGMEEAKKLLDQVEEASSTLGKEVDTENKASEGGEKEDGENIAETPQVEGDEKMRNLDVEGKQKEKEEQGGEEKGVAATAENDDVAEFKGKEKEERERNVEEKGEKEVEEEEGEKKKNKDGQKNKQQHESSSSSNHFTSSYLLPSLRYLEIPNCIFDSGTWTSMCKIIQNAPRLKTVCLNKFTVELPEEEMQEFSWNMFMPELFDVLKDHRSVSLSLRDVHPLGEFDGSLALARCIQESQCLGALDISGCFQHADMEDEYVRDGIMKLLSVLAGDSRLLELDLSNNALEPIHLDHFARIRADSVLQSSLRRLDLSFNVIHGIEDYLQVARSVLMIFTLEVLFPPQIIDEMVQNYGFVSEVTDECNLKDVDLTKCDPVTILVWKQLLMTLQCVRLEKIILPPKAREELKFQADLVYTRSRRLRQPASLKATTLETPSRNDMKDDDESEDFNNFRNQEEEADEEEIGSILLYTMEYSTQ